MSEFNFAEFDRQNVLGVIVIFTQSVRRMLNAYLAFFATTLFTDGIGNVAWIFFGVSILFMLVTSILRYKKFRFKISESQLILHSGILTKEVINIPLERIQSVHLHQNFIQRILGITGLKIDTAGSVAQELEIPALKKAKAKAMLQELTARSKPEKIKAEDLEQIENPVAENPEPKSEERIPLVELNFKALVVLALTENHIRNGLLAIAIVFGYLGQYLDYSEEYLIQVFDQYAPELVSGTLAQVLSFVIIFVVLSVTLSFLKVILQFFDFKASVGNKSFEIASGLLRRNEFTIPLEKIQFLEWQTNFVRKYLGFESIKIHQGKSTEAAGKNQLEIPACYAHQTNEVMATIFSEIDEHEEFYLAAPHSYQMVFRSIIFSLMGAPAFLTLALASGGYVLTAISFLAYVALVIYTAFRYTQTVNLWMNEDVIIYERGWLFPKRTVVKLFKLQSINIKQSIFQKRRGICHLAFSTAAGGRTFRFFDEKEMIELRNFLLYKTELHSGKWM